MKLKQSCRKRHRKCTKGQTLRSIEKKLKTNDLVALVHEDFGETESLVKVFQHQVSFEIKKLGSDMN